MLFGGGGFSAVAGLTSKMLADMRHQRGILYMINPLCTLVFGSLLAYVVYAFYGPSTRNVE
jgi:hypothetical protein